MERLHRQMQATPRQANHVVAMFSKMLSLAERLERRRRPEAALTEQQPMPPPPRYPKCSARAIRCRTSWGRSAPRSASLKRAGRTLSGCIEFLALSGARLSEAIELELGTVDFRTGAWQLADAKTGARIATLGAPALAVLANLGRTGGRAFPNLNAGMVERSG